MMKTLLIALMMVAGAASAATAADGNIYLGVLGGFNFSSAAFSPEQSFDLSARNRANLGAFVEFEMTQNLLLEARGMYVQNVASAKTRTFLVNLGVRF